MGKEKNPRKVSDNEAIAKLRMLKTSPQKLNLVAQLIRGKKVEKALADLTFSKILNFAPAFFNSFNSVVIFFGLKFFICKSHSANVAAIQNVPASILSPITE